MSGVRHFLDVDALSADELDCVLALAQRPDLGPVLSGQGVAMVFEKPSARTRNATEMAVFDLGGHAIYIQGHEVGLDTREPAEDVARTLASYHRVLCARVMDHRSLVRMAEALDAGDFGVPVVNLLSDLAHPCQAVADLLTLRQTIGLDLAGRSLAFVGDAANNVAVSLAKAAVLAGVDVRLAGPVGYLPTEEDRSIIAALGRAAGRGGQVAVMEDPVVAVSGADALYTDVWTSMGQEHEAERRRVAFEPFRLDEAMLRRAAPGAVVLHCLPAHRGEEITAAVFEGPQSVVWRQAANRRTAMRGLLAWLVGTPR